MFNENEEYEEEYETSQRMNEQHNFQNDNYDNPDIKNNNVSYREQNAEIEEEMNEIQNIPLSSNNQNQNNKSYISSQIQSYRVKPKCSKFLIFILTKYPECILNYLDLIEICYLRSVNSIFLETIHNYFQYRLRFEISIITQFQQMNIDKTEQFMKNIDAQIPLSTNNWLDFNLQSITTKLKILNRSIITKLRAIKSIGKLPDHIYAPFCIIFGYNKPINKLKTWKSTAHKILSEPNLILTIANLDLENLNDSDILNAFVYLNLPELEVKNISKFSNDFGKLILWCQAVVSYHIIIHPYTYRNDKGVIEYGGEVYEFAMEMSRLINRFYKFKRFLNRLNIVKLPLADYVFNLEHTRELPVEEENYLTKLTPEIIGNILSYLPYNESFRYITLAKLFYSGFKCSCDFYILKLLHELYHVKRRLNGKIPLIQIYNIFSSFYLMLNDILYISTGNFFTKEQMKDIKGLKSTSNIVNSIAKAFCLLCGIPPVRKSNAKGEVIILYLDKLKLFAINGSLNKIVKNANLLALDKKDILIIQEELVTFNTSEKLNEIRKINLGLYQVLIWSMLAVEFLKYFNPFEFIDEDFYFNTNESTNHNEEEARNKDAIIYHIDLLNSLKQHLHLKFHFSQGGNYCNPNYGFADLIRKLYNELLRQGEDSNTMNALFESAREEHNHIATVYFESKDTLPEQAKPTLYEKIMYEIIYAPERENNQINDSKTMEYNDSSNNIYATKEQPMNYNNNPLPKEMKYTHSTGNMKKHIPSLGNNVINTINKQPNKTVYNNTYMIHPSNFNNDYSYYDACLGNLPNELIIKHILFYLDILSLSLFSLVSKKINACIKTHIFLRLYSSKQEKLLIESQHSDTINSIENKRHNFYIEYEMTPPNKEHANNLINSLTTGDITEIKQCFRKYNKIYEQIIIPLLILLNEQPSKVIKPDGRKHVSYYTSAKTILFKKGFINRIRNLELEIIPYPIFQAIEKELKENPVFQLNRINSFSPCLQHLIFWYMGIIELHRTIRKYSLSEYDYDILSQDEIEFCSEMDKNVFLYYKHLRYANKHCNEYKGYANQIMEGMNLI